MPNSGSQSFSSGSQISVDLDPTERPTPLGKVSLIEETNTLFLIIENSPSTVAELLGNPGPDGAERAWFQRLSRTIQIKTEKFPRFRGVLGEGLRESEAETTGWGSRWRRGRPFYPRAISTVRIPSHCRDAAYRDRPPFTLPNELGTVRIAGCARILRHVVGYIGRVSDYIGIGAASNFAGCSSRC